MRYQAWLRVWKHVMPTVINWRLHFTHSCQVDHTNSTDRPFGDWARTKESAACLASCALAWSDWILPIDIASPIGTLARRCWLRIVHGIRWWENGNALRWHQHHIVHCHRLTSVVASGLVKSQDIRGHPFVMARRSSWWVIRFENPRSMRQRRGYWHCHEAVCHYHRAK